MANCRFRLAAFFVRVCMWVCPTIHCAFNTLTPMCDCTRMCVYVYILELFQLRCYVVVVVMFSFLFACLFAADVIPPHFGCCFVAVCFFVVVAVVAWVPLMCAPKSIKVFLVNHTHIHIRFNNMYVSFCCHMVPLTPHLSQVPLSTVNFNTISYVRVLEWPLCCNFIIFIILLERNYDSYLLTLRSGL